MTPRPAVERPFRISALIVVAILASLPARAASSLAAGATAGCSAHWHVVPVPDPTPDGHAGLEGISAIAADDIWAVGGYNREPGTYFKTLAVHWDGQEWSIVPSPNPGPRSNSLAAVDGVASDDVWAVGTIDFDEPLIEHWDGTAWTMVDAPSPSEGGPDQLYDVDAISAQDAWAVGVYFSHDEPRVLHWDGTEWSVVPAPIRGQDTALYAVSAISSTDAWSAGYYSRTILGRTQTFTVAWDGATWRAVKSPNVGTAEENEVRALDARTSTDAWATGFVAVHGGYRTLAMHWDGDRWRIASPPSPGNDFNWLGGIDAIGPAEVWAVGSWNDAGMGSRTLVARWDGAAWAYVRSPVPPGATGAGLRDVAAIDGAVWGVGSAATGPDESAPLVERACPS
jgi:hypothetical protein